MKITDFKGFPLLLLTIFDVSAKKFGIRNLTDIIPDVFVS